MRCELGEALPEVGAGLGGVCHQALVRDDVTPTGVFVHWTLPRHRLAVAGEPMRSARAFRRCRAAVPAQPYASTAGVNMACAFWATQARATHYDS